MPLLNVYLLLATVPNHFICVQSGINTIFLSVAVFTRKVENISVEASTKVSRNLPCEELCSVMLDFLTFTALVHPCIRPPCQLINQGAQGTWTALPALAGSLL